MKKTSYLLLALATFTFSSATFAGSLAGKDSARYYKSYPDDFDGKFVDVDCVFVTRINGGPQVEGVVFFTAQTKDDDNHTNGGSIVVAVLAEKADSFVRKYGDTPDVNRGSREQIDSKRLRGSFHQLDHGHVYIDMSSGEAHEAILMHEESAKGNIDRGEAGGATHGKGRKSLG